MFTMLSNHTLRKRVRFIFNLGILSLARAADALDTYKLQFVVCNPIFIYIYYNIKF